MTKSVLYEAHGDGSATVTLNRPERLNAINRPLMSDFLAALEQARADSIRVLLLRGAGRAFCSGEDLSEVAEDGLPEEDLPLWSRRLQDITRLLMFSEFYVVALVQGWVVGGGAAWPLNADMALWADNVRLLLPEAGYGLFVSGAVSFLLPERCGPEHAQRLMLLGERTDIRTLQRDRIADHVVPLGDLEREGRAVVDRLLALPARTLAAYKQARILQIRDAVEKALEFEMQQNLAGVVDPALAGRLPAAIAFKNQA